MVIAIGDPVVLTSNSRSGEDRLYDGQKGFAVNFASVEGTAYLFFLPQGVEGVFVLSADRFELDVEEKERLIKAEEE